MLPSTVTPSEFWWIGVLLDMIATLAGTIGKQLLRYAVVTKEMRYYPLGLFFTAVVDPVFDLSAYSFAAQSIIAPCAGMVVVWNVLLAPYTLQEKLTASRLIGAVLVCIGTVIMGLCGNHDEVDRTVAEYIALFSRPAAIIYYALFTLYCGAMTYVVLRKGRFASSFAQVALGGSFAGNMFTTKAVVEMADCFRDYDRTAEEIEGCSPNPFLGPTPYLFASVSLVLACISLWLLAVGLRDFEALYMITVFEGFMIIFGALSGTAGLSYTWLAAARPAGGGRAACSTTPPPPPPGATAPCPVAALRLCTHSVSPPPPPCFLGLLTVCTPHNRQASW